MGSEKVIVIELDEEEIWDVINSMEAYNYEFETSGTRKHHDEIRKIATKLRKAAAEARMGTDSSDGE